jgi:hypothetical protein
LVENVSVNDSKVCNWYRWLFSLQHHRSDVAVYMQLTQQKMEKIWSGSATETSGRDRANFEELRKALVSAAANETEWDKELMRLHSIPPMLDVPITPPE